MKYGSGLEGGAGNLPDEVVRMIQYVNTKRQTGVNITAKEYYWQQRALGYRCCRRHRRPRGRSFEHLLTDAGAVVAPTCMSTVLSCSDAAVGATGVAPSKPEQGPGPSREWDPRVVRGSQIQPRVGASGPGTAGHTSLSNTCPAGRNCEHQPGIG